MNGFLTEIREKGEKKIDGTKLPASFAGVELGRDAELLSQDII